MQSAPPIVVRAAAADAFARLNELVLAWALDATTRQPRYILELDADHRGKQCDCICASCDAPLVAVNAAKEVFRKRPHFRHPEGADRDQCAVLSARIALLAQFQEFGIIALPRRQMSASARGLSGQDYAAWVESPAEQVRITEVNFCDRAYALLTLDDGRQLRVQLIGTAGTANPTNPGVACVYLEVDDPAVASLSPEELRARLSLLPDIFRWCSHWDDLALAQQAELAAAARAESLLDAVPKDLELPADMDPALKRETVLHYAVKQILAQACTLQVPAIEVRVEQRTARGRTLRETWSRPEERLALTAVRLEERFGRVIPDVTVLATRPEGTVAETLHIEVTVTNAMDGERLARIRAANVATLEIDLGQLGGHLTRDGLKAFVLDEVAAKRWLHHSVEVEQRRRLEALLSKQVEALNAAAEAERAALLPKQVEALNATAQPERAVRAMPIHEVASAYRAALTRWLDLVAKSDTPAAQPEVEREAQQQAAAARSMMTVHGYPEAGHHEFYQPRRILSRLLSIEADRGIGYRLPSAWGVLNAIRQSRVENRSNHTLYLMAARAYPPRLNAEQLAWLEDWRREVKTSIEADDTIYLRVPVCDRVIGLLFPAMAAALKNPFGKRTARPIGAGSVWASSHPNDDGWLRGAALEEWMKAHPDAAPMWKHLLRR